LGREEAMSIRKATPKKRSSADIKRAIEQIETEIATERKKREKSGETFTALTREQIEKKLRRVESPMIVFQSWNNTAPPGGTINYRCPLFVAAAH